MTLFLCWCVDVREWIFAGFGRVSIASSNDG